MKIALLLIVFFSSQLVKSQLTNSEVYDYTIGDVIQYAYDADAPGTKPVYTDSVIGKYYSLNSDTLFYIIDKFVYQAAYLPPSTATYTYLIDTVIITELDSLASETSHLIPPHIERDCVREVDSTLFDQCGNLYESNYSEIQGFCFEAVTWHSNLYKGLGGPYYYNYDPVAIGSGPAWYAKNLVYYKSHVYGECGTRHSVAGLLENKVKLNITISPNPTAMELNVTSDLKDLTYSIYTIEGQIIKSKSYLESDKMIDVSSFKPGFYFIRFSSNESFRTISFIKE